MVTSWIFFLLNFQKFVNCRYKIKNPLRNEILNIFKHHIFKLYNISRYIFIISE